MDAKKIALITSAVIIGSLVMAGSSYAAFGGHKGPRINFDEAPAEIQDIITQAREDGRDSLSDDQKDTLRAYHEEIREARFGELPEEVQDAIEKKRAGEELTDEEKELLREHKPHKKGKHKGHFKKELLENAPDEIQRLVEYAKENGRDSLTDDQKEQIKDYFDSVRPDREDRPERPDRDDIASKVRELIQQAQEEGRDSLTASEIQLLFRWFNAQQN